LLNNNQKPAIVVGSKLIASYRISKFSINLIYAKCPLSWWELKSKNRPVDKAKEAYNDKMKEQDNRPIREAIIAVVRQTSKKVLIVPENETQVRIGKEMLYDPLPADVKEKVV
jgi:hypothetical protein